MSIETTISENLNLLGHLAYTLIFFSFLVSNIFWLRVLAIFASFASIAYNYFVPADPLWISIQWNILFITTNSFRIFMLLWDKRRVDLQEHEKFIHENFFEGLSSGELKRLVNKGYLRTSIPNELLIKQGEEVSSLIMIYKGSVKVLYNGELIKELGQGRFVGEMSFLTKSVATADIRTNGQVKYFIWSKSSLQSLTKKNAKLMAEIQNALSRQLVEQVLDQKQKETPPPLKIAA